MDLKLIIFSCVMASAAAAVTINDCPSYLPRDRYLRAFGNSCYRFILNHERSFDSAERECESRRGHLVIIRDPATQNFLYHTLRSDFHYNDLIWIGLSDSKNEGQFIWVDGSPAKFTNWAFDQPGVIGGLEDCVAMDTTDGGRWHDYNCDDFLFINHEYYFVCEYPVVRHTTPTTTTSTTTTTTTTTTTAAQTMSTTPEPTPTTTPKPTTVTTTPEPTTVTITPEPTTTTSKPTTTTTTPPPTTTSTVQPTTQKSSTTPMPTTTTPEPSTTTTTTTTTESTTASGCPPFQCSLDCGLSGYKVKEIDDRKCVLCECEE